MLKCNVRAGDVRIFSHDYQEQTKEEDEREKKTHECKEKKYTLLNWKDRQIKSIRLVNAVLRYELRFSLKKKIFYFAKSNLYFYFERQQDKCDRLR